MYPSIKMKRLAILGCTGSIGTQALEVIARFPDRFKVDALAAHGNLELLESQTRRFTPRMVCLYDAAKAQAFEQLNIPGVTVTSGLDGLNACAALDRVDMVVMALVGAIGLAPTLWAIENGKDIALANKETLVAGGALVMPAVRRHGVSLIPLDSEHSAIFQCLRGEDPTTVERLVITASGGAFRDWKAADLAHATPEDALNHPNWAMGSKITIDSATLMNKALEVIEAHHLYEIPFERIEAVIHRQSIVHSLVRFVDTSVIAQLGFPDMKLPIQYALAYPERLPNADLTALDMAECQDLTFRKIDPDFYPCFEIGVDAGKTGGTVPAVMNAANEVAVQAFLEKRIGFLQISQIVHSVIDAHTVLHDFCLEDIMRADDWARKTASRRISNT